MPHPSPGRIPLRVKGLLVAFFLSAFAKIGQITIIGKQVYDMTGRELDLGLIGNACRPPGRCPRGQGGQAQDVRPGAHG